MSKASTTSRIVAVDGTWLMHRAFHVRPSAVPYMVFGWICRFAVTRRATHIVACFDSGRSFRHDIYDGYKANRGESSPIKEYTPVLSSMLAKANIGAIYGDTFEADDLLATIGNFPTLRQAGLDCKVELVTPDKDNLQCITEFCQVLRPGVSGKPDVLWGLDKLASEMYGLLPRQYLDLQTLFGDKTDCIPQLMTPAKASRIIKEHGSLMAYLKADEAFASKNAEALNRNRKLVKLLKGCVDFEPEHFQVAKIKSGLDFKSDWYSQLTSSKKSLFSSL